jgi:hypothetical protein
MLIDRGDTNLRARGEKMTALPPSDATLIDAIQAWQSRPDIEPLRCPARQPHRPFIACQLSSGVALVCPDCGYIQRWIPDYVLRWAEERPKP